jgi:hypothetical protein
MTDQQTLETWEMKMRRLAVELKAMCETPPHERRGNQSRAITRKRYEIARHIEEVDE